MIGYIGSILLGICAVPELIRTVRDSRCHVGWGMLLSWYLGEIFVFIHIWNTSKDQALLLNYSTNILILSVMIYYKIFVDRPKK
jgi:hypothetical protein